MTNCSFKAKQIVLIGAGNLATHLALALKEVGHKVVAVCSASGKTAQCLANQIGQGCVAVSGIETLPLADYYIIAAKDDSISQIAEVWPTHLKSGIVLHTSGSVALSSLFACGLPCGVLYPLQTFSKERSVNFKEIPCFIEGNNDLTTLNIKQLADSISQKVHSLTSSQRRVLHLSAVFACNFVNHIYDIARQQLEAEGLPFDYLRPLIAETAAKVSKLSPRSAQTGPAIRGDERVMNAHRELLSDSPEQLALYNLLSESIYHTFHS